MIDTIKIKIKKEDLPTNYKILLESILDDKEEVNKENGLSSLRGRLSNFRITINDRELAVEGSLTKYAIGDNLHFADKEQLRLALCNLGQELNINLFQGMVTRLDLAGNIITKYPVEEYYHFLIDLKRLKRQEQSNGLSFGNDSRHVSFYGKIKEMKYKRDTDIDEDFINRNILRYEYRYSRKKSISDFLKINAPVVNDIFENYNLFIKSWIETFEAINKKRDILEPSADLFLKKGEFDRFIKRKGVEALGGTMEVFKMIEIAKKRKYLSKYPNAATNIKRGIKDLMIGPLYLMQKSTLVEELEQKIKFIGFCALSHKSIA